MGSYGGLVELDNMMRIPESGVLLLHVIAMLCLSYNSLLYWNYVHEFDYI